MASPTSSSSSPPPSSSCCWSVGQLVNVKPRTWTGINRPGGVGKIIKLHFSNGYVESMDVKYLVGSGSSDKCIDLDFCQHYQPLESKSRSRRGRDFYVASPAKRKTIASSEADDDAAATMKRTKTSAKATAVARAARDENTDPKQRTKKQQQPPQQKPKTSSIRNIRQVKKTPKVMRRTSSNNPNTNDTTTTRPPPATHVTVSNKSSRNGGDDVSPLRDTPTELRRHRRHPSKQSMKQQQRQVAAAVVVKSSSNVNNKSTRTNNGSRGGVAKSTRVTTKTTESSRSSSNNKAPTLLQQQQHEPDFCIQKAPRPAVLLHGHQGTSWPTAARATSTTAAAAQPQAKKRLPLKRVMECQVKSANTFVEGVLGKPQPSEPTNADAQMTQSSTLVSSSLKREETGRSSNNPLATPVECTVSPSPPNTERIDLFISTLSQVFDHNDDDDEGIDKAVLLEAINGKLKAGMTHFDGQEMEGCLSALATDGKVMVSDDGMVYSF